MRRITSTFTAVCASAMLVSASAAAQQPDTHRLTFVTFSAPVSLPGVTLPAGSYAFKLLNSQVNRNVVQVFDRDQTKIFATIIAIPAQRNEPTDETVITFREAPANTPPAVRYWYYPGEKGGQEFAYPKAQAMAIANAARESVLSIENESGDAEAMKSGTIGRVEPDASSPQVTADATRPEAPAPQAAPTAAPPAAAAATPPTPAEQPAQPAPAPQPEVPSRETAAPSTPAPSASAPAPSTAAPLSRETQSAAAPAPSPAPEAGTSPGRELPKTASELPLVGLAGLLALAGACGVRAVRYARG